MMPNGTAAMATASTVSGLPPRARQRARPSSTPAMMPAMMHNAYARIGTTPKRTHSPCGGLGITYGNSAVGTPLTSHPEPRAQALVVERGEVDQFTVDEDGRCAGHAPLVSRGGDGGHPVGMGPIVHARGELGARFVADLGGQLEQLLRCPLPGGVGEQRIEVRPRVSSLGRTGEGIRRTRRPVIDEGHRIDVDGRLLL